MTRKTMQVVKDRAEEWETMVRPAELADARFSDRSLANPPSARAWKLLALLLAHVGDKVPDDRYHEISLARLNDAKGMGNLSFADAEALAEELRGVTMFIGISGELTADGLIGATKRPLNDNGPKVFRWKFGESLREAFGASEIWALLERQAIMSMTSRYAMRLYEITALRGSLKYKTSEVFSLDDMRARLGVPEGKLRTWDQLWRRAIEPAMKEVTQLTRYNLEAVPIKEGRAYTQVKIAWSIKPDMQKVKRELDDHSAVRKARRNGKTEEIAASDRPLSRHRPFPPSGIHPSDPTFGPILSEAGIQTATGAREAADSFRSAMKREGIPLDAPDIAERFSAFCSVLS